jgi:DNA-binding phage protein
MTSYRRNAQREQRAAKAREAYERIDAGESVTSIARALGISRAHLYRSMAEFPRQPADAVPAGTDPLLE